MMFGYLLTDEYDDDDDNDKDTHKDDHKDNFFPLFFTEGAHRLIHFISRIPLWF